MDNRHSTDDRLVRYLLGDSLPDAEQAAIEERYFTDDVYFDHLLFIEDELIDSHLRGSLPPDDKARFEKHFLASSRRRDKWEAERAIASFFRSRSRPTFVNVLVHFFRSLTIEARVLAVISGAVLVVGVAILGARYVGLSRERDRLESRVVELQRQAARLPAVATFTLRSGRLRSGAGDDFQIPRNTRWVELQVQIPGFASEFSMFAGTLASADGRQISEQSGLSRMDSWVEIDLPASMLMRGDYVLSLRAEDGRGGTEIPAYQFRIDR